MLNTAKGLAALLCLLLSSFPHLIPFQKRLPSKAAPRTAKPIKPSDKEMPPNIILILTDDLDVKSISHMPNLTALLIKKGTRFTNFFTGLSLCCPSRASILRGQYAHNHGIVKNSPPNGGFQGFRDKQLESSTIATWLQSAGYETVLIGKYFNGYPDRNLEYIPPGWNQWYAWINNEEPLNSSDPDEDAPSHYFNYKLNENGKIVFYGNNPEDYLTDVQAQKALNFLQHAAGNNKPFFLHLSVHAPHTPAIPAPRHRNALSKIKGIPRTTAFNEQDVSDKPTWIRKMPLLSNKQIDDIDRLYRRRLQMMLSVDDLLASIIEKLAATDQLTNTYIFFTSDNGYHMGQHRLPSNKSTLYEEDIHVPMIVRGPGVVAGRVVEELAGNVDLAQTFAELAGITTPNFVDGRSLLPLLKNAPSAMDKWRKVFLLERFSSSEKECKGLHTKIYKYVEYTNGEHELYNLKKDPQELNNIYQQADKTLISELSSRLMGMRDCKSQRCRDLEEEPLFADNQP
ncbi:MAG: sulfatase [Acidobacteriota bacterium]